MANNKRYEETIFDSDEMKKEHTGNMFRNKTNNQLTSKTENVEVIKTIIYFNNSLNRHTEKERYRLVASGRSIHTEMDIRTMQQIGTAKDTTPYRTKIDYHAFQLNFSLDAHT